mmetsp:Transcript_4841/g.14434  ORF Transcript_4841/g.14434 Transcript_4841/m.14434 type:complete len:258 (+) Transcript_4841:2537-3310(+)
MANTAHSCSTLLDQRRGDQSLFPPAHLKSSTTLPEAALIRRPRTETSPPHPSNHRHHRRPWSQPRPLPLLLAVLHPRDLPPPLRHFLPPEAWCAGLGKGPEESCRAARAPGCLGTFCGHPQKRPSAAVRRPCALSPSVSRDYFALEFCCSLVVLWKAADTNQPRPPSPPCLESELVLLSPLLTDSTRLYVHVMALESVAGSLCTSSLLPQPWFQPLRPLDSRSENSGYMARWCVLTLRPPLLLRSYLPFLVVGACCA